jgi:hypothetical protein
MGEVDDPQQSKNDCKTKAQHRVERPVDKTEQQLPEKSLQRDPENIHAAFL